MSHRQENSLYVVATPIGNLRDITFRAVEVLSRVDLVVSEHVRKSRNLLKRYSIETKVLSYREDNALRVIPRILDALGAGKAVASDPGRRLVEAAANAGFRVVPVPGASAVIAAISVSGLDDPRFVFEGFLPRRPAKRRKRLRELASEVRPLVLFEAPHRLLGCLSDMKAVLGDRKCVVAREITKLHEDIARGRISVLIDRFSGSPPRGEFVLVCEGSYEPAVAVVTESALKEAKALVADGMKKHRAAMTVAKRYGLKSGDLYEMLAAGTRDSRKGEVA
jgi:16S rRNA (cytidine1402-2'-O)-methyltransferase